MKEIIESIYKMETLKEVFELINDVCPTWIVSTADSFVQDYEFLERNWEYICVENKCRKTKILIVTEIVLVDESKEDINTLIKTLSELLTRSGFVVRGVRDLQLCPNCKNAIPTEGMYNTLKTMKVKDIPEEYSPCCRKC